MARGNTPRWNWLMETFKGLSPELQFKIRLKFADHYSPRYALDPAPEGPPDDQVMYEIMVHDIGLILKGTDPCPPPIKYATDAGAQEYDEVMLVQELGEGL